MRRFRGAASMVLTVAAVLLPAAAAPACPFCDGGPDGRNAVHDAIFNDGFWLNLAAGAAPFAVMATFAAVIHGGRLRRRTERGADERPR